MHFFSFAAVLLFSWLQSSSFAIVLDVENSGETDRGTIRDL
jgi:hypothetical protein